MNFPGFDAGRFIAVVLVVWIHASIGVPVAIHPDAGFIGRFAVPFFALTVVLFSALGAWRNPARAFGGYAAGRLRRIGLPFAAWTAIYLVLKAVSGRPYTLDWSTLWLGGSYQLWFLPFALAVSLLAFLAARMAQASPAATLGWGIAAAAMGLALALLPWAWTSGSEKYGLDLWVEVLPATAWGFALACAYRLDGWQRLRGLHWAWGASLLVAAIAAACFLPQQRLLFNLAGVGLALAAITAPANPLVARVAALGVTAFGIYLSHILFIGPLRSFAARFGAETSLAYALIATLIALLASLALTRVLLRMPRLRWLVE